MLFALRELAETEHDRLDLEIADREAEWIGAALRDFARVWTLMTPENQGRPACKPGVQVSASEVEARVLHLLHPERVEGASRVAVQVLDALVPVCPRLAQDETAEAVRLLVRRATWASRTRSVALVLNESGLEWFANKYDAEFGLS